MDLLSIGSGGSTTYAEEMLPRLAQYGHEFHILLTKGKAPELRRRLEGHANIIDAATWTQNPFLRHLYQRISVPKILTKISANVLFVPGGLTGTRSMKSAGIRQVVMLRNMLAFNREERARFSWLGYPVTRMRLGLLSKALLRIFRDSDRIIFISRHSAEVVGPQLGSKDYRIIPHGLSDSFVHSTKLDDELKAQIRSRYFLYVSSLDPYKHQDVVIQGFEMFRQQVADHANVKLVFAGPGSGPFARRIRNVVSNSSERLVYLGNASRESLPGLIRGAEILLYASTCETCPNILIEYLAAGQPIICSATQPMPEFGGDACEYISSLEPKAWCNALIKLHSNVELRRNLGLAASRQAAHFTIERSVAATIAALTEWVK